ncbi:MAG TPA: hypothetical protein VFK82_04930 [Burkholderiaceae bacterium]|nr:hypothetical protein [Burkholderiaceae bacterium]
MFQTLTSVKAASQDVVSHSVEALSTVVDSASKASELAVGAIKENAAELISVVRNAEGWTPEAGFANPQDVLAPVSAKVAKYGKQSLKLAADTQESLASTTHSAVKTLVKHAESMTDELGSTLPAPVEPLLKNYKAALAQSLALYEQAATIGAQMQKQAFAAGEQFFAQVDKAPADVVVQMAPKRKRA